MTRRDAQRLARVIGRTLAANPSDGRTIAAAVSREFAADAGTTPAAYFAEIERAADVARAAASSGGDT